MMEIIKMVSYLPQKKISNDDLSKLVDTSDEWIKKRTGIRNRYWSNDETLAEMVIKCVDKFTAEDKLRIDAIIFTSMSNKEATPSMSAQIANHFNIQDVLCIDLNAACSGYIYAVITAIALLESERFEKVLVASGEKMMDIIDIKDRTVSILFGDAVAASLLENKIKNNVLNIQNRTLKSDKELFIDSDGYLRMLGQDVFKFAYKAIVDCIDKTLSESNIEIEEIDYFFFHQANARIINKVSKKYALREDKVIMNIDEVANTSSASIPLLMSEVDIEENKVVFMCGFGAGLSYGSILYRS